MALTASTVDQRVALRDKLHTADLMVQKTIQNGGFLDSTSLTEIETYIKDELLPAITAAGIA